MNRPQKILTSILKLGLAIIFITGTAKMPYSFYEFLRVIGFVGFLGLGYIDYTTERNGMAFFWILSAIIINPIFKVILQKDYWIIIDIIWAVVLVVTVFIQAAKELRKTKKI